MISIEKIARFLPHRFPFLLVDRVLDLTPGKAITALKNVTCNEQFFQGHFPEWKIMPGVLIIEAIAQAGGILLFNSIPDPETKLVVLSKVDKFKFKKVVVPGDQLRLEVEFVRLKGRVWHMNGRAVVDGGTAAEGNLFASVLDRKDLDDRT
jgi:3-hydroxyacyl-[acyl-carrier-protein] dehydratase